MFLFERVTLCVHVEGVLPGVFSSTPRRIYLQNCTFHTFLSLLVCVCVSLSAPFSSLARLQRRRWKVYIDLVLLLIIHTPAPLSRSSISFIMKLFAVVVATVTLAFTVPSVTAAGELDFACGEFIGALCGGLPREQVKECLRRNRDKLDRPCHEKIIEDGK